MNATDTISPMEMMGALSGLLIHDLSNHISVISGNAQFTQMLAAGSEKISRTTKAMVKASKAATSTLVGFGGFRRTIYDFGNSMDPSDLQEAVTKGCFDWKCEFSNTITGNVGFESRWTVHCVAQMRELTGSETGTFSVTQLKFEDIPERPGRRFRGYPARELIEIKTVYAADEPVDFMRIREAFGKFELLAAYEMVHACGGWIDSFAVSEGKKAIAIYLPVKEEESVNEVAEVA